VQFASTILSAREAKTNGRQGDFRAFDQMHQLPKPDLNIQSTIKLGFGTAKTRNERAARSGGGERDDTVNFFR
jgi:hypothetical protein